MTRSQFNVLPRVLTGSLSRRALLRGAAGGGATAAFVAAGVAHAAGQPNPAAPEEQAEPQTREFVLTATEFDWELMPGTTVRAWGYNDQVPGPELRVREGDWVRVTLRNELPVPTTIHWHGVNLPPAMDGPAGLNQAAVQPGEEFVYEYEAKPAGSRWYHSHADPALQVPMGLYGSLVIEPRVPIRPYDREYTLMLAEWDLELTPAIAAGKAQRGPRDRGLRGGELGSDLFLINGRMHGAVPPIRLAEDESILLRLMNAGHLSHPFHTHGHSFKIVATDGNPVPVGMEWIKDTVLIAPGERYDLEVVGDNPGVWMVHCHIEHHMANGMMTLLAYDGHEPTGPAADFFAVADGEAAAGGHDGHGASKPEATGATASTTATALPERSSAADGAAVEVAMVDDRFEPNVLSVPAGTTVVWINRGHDWHSVAAFDGSFASEKVAPGERYAHRFDEPGTYQYICRHHGLQGMIGKIVVT